jgi:hypothetical protein
MRFTRRTSGPAVIAVIAVIAAIGDVAGRKNDHARPVQ